MPAPPKPPRTPPKSKRRIVRKTPLRAGSATARRRTRVRPMSDRKRAEVRLRTDVTRPAVLARDGYSCRACGKESGSKFAAERTPFVFWWLEVHEEPPRSLGGDPNDPADCITLCQTVNGDGCHGRMKASGRNRITIEKGPDGCNGLVTFRQGDKSWTG